MMRINYLLGLPTFLMIIGLAWASHSHANAHWENTYNELDYDDLPEVESLLPENSMGSSFDLEPAQKGSKKSKQDQNVLELVNQIDSMQREMQELRGQLELQNHELKLMKDQSLASAQKPAQATPSNSLNSNSGLELNSAGITYKPAGS